MLIDTLFYASKIVKKKTLIKILRKKAEANAVFCIPPHLLYSYTRENTRLTLRN